jgi:hypothetical protein
MGCEVFELLYNLFQSSPHMVQLSPGKDFLVKRLLKGTSFPATIKPVPQDGFHVLFAVDSGLFHLSYWLADRTLRSEQIPAKKIYPTCLVSRQGGYRFAYCWCSSVMGLHLSDLDAKRDGTCMRRTLPGCMV